MVNTNLIARFFNQMPVMQQQLSKEQLEALRQFVKELQLGESIEGILIKELNSGYVLEVNEEIRIPVSILEPVQVGDLLKFNVIAKKQDEIQLKIQTAEPTPLIDKITQDLALPKDEKMNKCLNQFMQKELTLTRENLLHTYYIEKHYQIPSAVMTNVLARKSGITEEQANKLARLRQQGLARIGESLKQIFGACIGEDEVEELTQLIEKYNPKGESKELLKEIFNRPHEEETKIIQQSNRLKNSLQVGQEKLEKVEKNFMIGRLVDSLIGINPQNSKNLQKQLRINIEILQEVIEFIERQEKGGPYKEQLLPLKESLEVVQKLNNEGNYFLFPLIYQQELNQAEIYFFEPKKRQKDKKHATYVVIALDLSALKHIEIHIHKIDKNLVMEIIVAHQEIEQWLMTYTEQLKQEVEQMGYTLKQCTYKVQGEKMDRIGHQYTSINHFDWKI
ncbi:MAG: flagellar hook-length control protein FliK [Cellulosilyticaceae bacterium]